MEGVAIKIDSELAPNLKRNEDCPAVIVNGCQTMTSIDSKGAAMQIDLELAMGLEKNKDHLMEITSGCLTTTSIHLEGTMDTYAHNDCPAGMKMKIDSKQTMDSEKK